jgi:fructose 1,6-bisphosphatase
MENQLGSSELEYVRLTGRIAIEFALLDGRKIRLTHTLGEDDFQLFEVRWERFKVSDEIFFDLGEFTRVLTT